MPKTADLVTETFKEDGLLAKIMPGYKEREQQIELARKIQKCIQEGKPLIAEAPTGVGKSLAALVAAVEHILRTDEPVIIATSSIILQEQYINKDIPLLEELYNISLNPVLIKGRNNYVCPKKVNDARSGKMGATTSEMVKECEEVLKWATTSLAGDKSELDFVPKYQTWAQFACVDRNECTGKQCPFYDICPYYRQRSKVGTAKLIVCNYHYFFTALESEGNMLPSTAKVVIMDEGHEINEIARDFQEKKYSVKSLQQHFDYFTKAMDRARLSDIGDSTYKLLDEMELDTVNGSLINMFVGLSHEYKLANPYMNFHTLELPERTRLQKYARDHIEALLAAADVADAYLKKFGFSFEQLKALEDYFSEEAIDWMIAVNDTVKFLMEKAALVQYMFAFDEEQDDSEFIFWLQPMNDSVSIHAKPLNGSGLTKHLFKDQEEKKIPIVMSATLTANQSFNHIKEDLGIEEDKEAYPVEELIVSSPFNLTDNLLWYLPSDTPAGNQKDHLPFVLGEMQDVIEELNGRALCLFTSRKNLIEAEEYFKQSLPKGINIISQEDMPKQKIIDYVKENDNTVLLGTKSFFTGIDIQGHHISAVLIDKLPYPIIGDPVNDYLMNEPRGFHKFSLPEAIIKLKQAFGRLNRTVTDKGIVMVFDGRLSTARYKNKIFNSFDFKVTATQDWEVVQSYIKELQLP